VNYLEGGVMAAVALPALVFVIVAGLLRGRPAGRIGAQAALVVYLGVLAALVFFPLPTSPCTAAPEVQLVPFRTLALTWRGGLDSHIGRIGVGNVLAFLPLGFLVPLVWPDGPAVVEGLTAAFVVSVVVEACQYLLGVLLSCGYRTSDIDDVILNTAGGLVGALAAWIVLRLVGRGRFRRPKRA
jgi:glycopeptide antibiotics resistance protein